MWIAFAVGSAFFAGITAILAKCGIKKTDSDVATAIRTIVVLAFAWIMVFIVGSANTLPTVSAKTYIFLVLSGLATGASWLCYFKALQLGNVNKVVPVDKSSIVLTIVLAFIFLGETPNVWSIIGLVGITIGTFLMIEKKDVVNKETKGKGWFVYALLSAVFASLTSILGKIGIQGVESYLGTAIRTGVVLVMAWIVVFSKKKQGQVKNISKKELLFILLSGVATGGSWLCYYKALQDGLVSVVNPIDKLSIVVAVAFSYLVFKEKMSKKAFWGLVINVLGTLAMVVPTVFGI